MCPLTKHWRIVDIHCHVLPNLDDGPATTAGALEMCRLYRAQGVRTLVATPHMGERLFSVTAEAARLGAHLLSQACGRQGIDLEVLPGADVRLYPELIEDLDAGRLPTLGDRGRCLLIELPVTALPPLEDLAAQLAERGITPVLTHPERHRALGRRPERLRRLLECGFQVQITGGSLLGVFGGKPQRAAEEMLAAGHVRFVAGDAHAPYGPRRPEFPPVVDRLIELVGEQQTHALLCENPAEALGLGPVSTASVGADSEGGRDDR